MLDIIIKGGLVYDGTSRLSYKADIGIKGEKIVQLAVNLDDVEAKQIIDATGKCVTPGFIDPHTHVDMSVLFEPTMESFIRQGVTTVVTGNCGHAPAPMGSDVFRGPITQFDILKAADPSYFQLFPIMLPKQSTAEVIKENYGFEANWNSFDSFLCKCSQLPLGCNMVTMVGYSAIRSAVMGMNCLRDATCEEIEKMERMVDECMAVGAYGLSTGRDPNYIPGPYATMDEMKRMLKVVAQYDGMFSSHTYNYNLEGQTDRIGGYKEMFELAFAANIRANVSHVHVTGMANNNQEAIGAVHKSLELFEQVTKKGIDLSYDVIPDPFASDFTIPYFAFYLKPFVQMSGSRAHLAENFRVPDFRKMVQHVVSDGFLPYFDIKSKFNWFSIMRINKHNDSRFVGKSIMQCAEELKMDPLSSLMYMFSLDYNMNGNIIIGAYTDAVDILCNQKMAMPCSDGFSYKKDKNLTGSKEIPLYPSTANIDYIPRFLSRYGKVCFEDVVYRASGFVAERFGIKDRGVIKEGNYADIVVLDRESLHCSESQEYPLQNPKGIETVLVNGCIALKDGLVSPGAGRVLRKI